ncbi:DUF5017 domain-containing protein [Pedobacter nanyangensis]|uniref:DUF5017 domain-containing protein n=1 Tax=Pedobacter nanyangensis TaxID=1562389 RepID=UPI000DE30644|nr:DUF5017 domain-containing protein [Pedobacter nanyangensis]
MKNNMIYAALLGFCLASCDKEKTLSEPVFEVKANASTYKVGDRVQFNLTGNPDIVSFYSGEVGNDYNYVQGRVMPATSALSFTTRVLAAGQTNQFEVLASSDFNGIYTLENVQAATWVPLNSRINLATANTEVNAGTVSVNDALSKGKAIYIGFRYKTKAKENAGNLLGARWRVTNFSFLISSAISSEEKALSGSAGWNVVTSSNYEANRVRITSAYLEFMGNATNTSVDTEGWIITYPILFDGFITYLPDKSKPIKSIGSQSVQNYTHIYQQAGTYKATFIAANANTEGSKQIKREITLNIIP